MAWIPLELLRNSRNDSDVYPNPYSSYPAQAGYPCGVWIPACAGVTREGNGYLCELCELCALCGDVDVWFLPRRTQRAQRVRYQKPVIARSMATRQFIL